MAGDTFQSSGSTIVMGLQGINLDPTSIRKKIDGAVLTFSAAEQKFIAAVPPGGTVTAITATAPIVASPASITTNGNLSVQNATVASVGVVQPDGTTVAVNGSGVISVPTATLSAIGLVKPDGTSITVDGTGTISTIAAGVSSLTYFFYDTASDVSTYKNLFTIINTTLATVTATGLATGTTTIQNWITALGQPGITYLLNGYVHARFHATQTSGTKNSQIFFELWETDSSGTNIALITTSDLGPIIQGTQTKFDVYAYIGSQYTFASISSRLRVAVRVTVSGTGSAPTVQFSYGGTAAQSGNVRIEIPVGAGIISASTQKAVEFNIASGVAGTNVGPIRIAWGAGSFTKCKIVTKTSDGVTPLTIAIKRNGVDVFSADPTIPAGTTPNTITTYTALTANPFPFAPDDLFTIDITSGTSSWAFTAQLE